MYNYIQSTGVIVPDTADTRAEVEQEWKDALQKQDLVTTADTPQGVLITQETTARQNVALNNAALANQINPNLATGVFLDAIYALMGGERPKATRTLVRQVELRGIPQTLCEAGEDTVLRTDANDNFMLRQAVMLDSTGFGVGDFESVEFGPIPCPSNTLTNIVSGPLGLETANNPSSGTLGSETMSDDALRMLRNLTLARQGISTVEAQVSGLYDITGVKSLQYRENVASTEQVIDGITMKPHSVWACVDGGTDEDIARSLFNNKTDGAGWNGAVSVPIVDEWSGQTYTILFDRPTERPIIARVTVSQGTSTADPQVAVRDAIEQYAAGEMPGDVGLKVGIAASPYELSGAVNYFYPGLFVRKVEIAFVGGSWQTDELAIAINEKATITGSSVTVIVQ